MDESQNLEVITQKELLGAILRTSQCLSMVSLKTGIFDMDALYAAKNALVSRGLIRPNPRTVDYLQGLVVYEPNV